MEKYGKTSIYSCGYGWIVEIPRDWLGPGRVYCVISLSYKHKMFFFKKLRVCCVIHFPVLPTFKKVIDLLRYKSSILVVSRGILPPKKFEFHSSEKRLGILKYFLCAGIIEASYYRLCSLTI